MAAVYQLFPSRLNNSKAASVSLELHKIMFDDGEYNKVIREICFFDELPTFWYFRNFLFRFKTIKKSRNRRFAK